MSDFIKLTFPSKTKYISAIRLAVTGACAETELGVDRIDDLRSCVSESCLLFMCNQKCADINIEAEIDKDVAVRIFGDDTKDPMRCRECGEFSSEMSKLMIEALSDECEFDEEDGVLKSITFKINETVR